MRLERKLRVVARSTSAQIAEKTNAEIDADALMLGGSENPEDKRRFHSEDEARYGELMRAWDEAMTELMSFPLFVRGKLRGDRLSEYRYFRRREATARTSAVKFITDHLFLEDAREDFR